MLHLKTKLSILKENFQERQKNDKKKSNYLVDLEKKYLNLCPNAPLSELKTQILQSKNVNQSFQANPKGKKENKEEEFWKLRAKVRLLAKTVTREHKILKQKNKLCERIIEESSSGNKNLEIKIKEKEKVFFFFINKCFKLFYLLIIF